MDRVRVRQVESMAGPAGTWPRGVEHELELGEALRMAAAGIVAIAGAPYVAEEPVEPEPEAPEFSALREALAARAPLEEVVDLADDARALGETIPADLAPAIAALDAALAAAGDAALASLGNAPSPEEPAAPAASPAVTAPVAEAAPEPHKRAAFAPAPQRIRKPAKTAETAVAAPAPETR